MDVGLIGAGVEQSSFSRLIAVRTWPTANKILFVSVLLIVLQTADGILTSMGISRFGLAIEGNPLLRSLMAEFGHVPTLAVSKMFAISVVIALAYFSRQLPWVRGAMGAISCIYIFAAIIPWTYILFLNS